MSEKWVTIGRYDNVPTASIIRARLEAEGFETRIPNENFSSVLPLGRPPKFLRVQLQVREEDAEEALALLEREASEPFEEEDWLEAASDDAVDDEPTIDWGEYRTFFAPVLLVVGVWIAYKILKTLF